MEVTFRTPKHNGKIESNRRSSFYKQLSVITPDLLNPIIARFYGTGTRIYCCLWVNNADWTISVNGGGFAGGGGYHKESAALEDAIRDAGITLSEAIGGRGENAMDEALNAISAALGCSLNARIFRAYA